MSVVYLATKIAESKQVPVTRGRGMTRDGYTLRSGAPSTTMIRLDGETVWRRVMVWQFSNAGNAFVRIKGEPHIVRDYDIPDAT